MKDTQTTKNINEDLDFGKIWKSITNVWDVAKIVIQDVLNVTAYSLKITFANDPAKIEEIIGTYRLNKDRIADRYKAKMSEIDQSIGPEMNFLMFIAAPGPYIAGELLIKEPTITKSLIQYFADAGVKISKWQPAADAITNPTGSEKVLADLMHAAFTGQRMVFNDTADFTNARKRVEGNIASKLGVGGVSETVDSIRQMINEARQNRSTEEIMNSVQGLIAKDAAEAIKSVDKKMLVSPEDFKVFVETKKKEANEYVDALNAPAKFAIESSKVETLEDFVESVNKLQESSIYKIEGLDDVSESKILEQAKKLAAQAKKQGQKAMEEVMLAANIKLEKNKVPTDQLLLNAAKIVSAKAALASAVEMFANPKESEAGQQFLKAQEQAKKEMLSNFMDELDEDVIDFLENHKDGQILLEIYEKGAEAIKNAGL